MVAIGTSNSRAGDSEEARVRKLVRDRKTASAETRKAKSRGRGRLTTSLASFKESSARENDGEGDEDEQSGYGILSIDKLISLSPTEAVKRLVAFGEDLRGNFVGLAERAGSAREWARQAWRDGELYHQSLVQIVIRLEHKRLLDERRFAALDQVYAQTSKNPDEAELNAAIGKFDSIVRRFTSDRKHIDNLYRTKDAAAEAAKRAYTKEMERAMNATSPSGESNTPRDRLGDAYGDEDDDVSEDFTDDAEKSQNSDDVRYGELAEALKNSPLLRTASGKVARSKLTHAASVDDGPASSLRQRDDALAAAVESGDTMTQVGRNLSEIAKTMPSEEEPSKGEVSRRPNLAPMLGKSLSFYSSTSVNDDNDARNVLSSFGRTVNELSDKELRSTIVRLVRTSIWNAFENVTSSPFAYWLAVFYITLIFASSLSFCIETLPEYKNGKSKNVFYGIELFSVIMFTIEYVLRSLCCPNYRKFVRQPLNVVDLCAILPFYLEAIFPLSVSSLQIIRTIRLVRVLRIVRLGVKFGRLSIIGSSIRECIDMLLVSLAIGSVCTVIFSTLIYYAEHGDYVASLDIYARRTDVYCEGLSQSVTSIYQSDGTLVSGCTHVESPYKSIPASFWWCMVTLMTVGYGDHVPATGWGKLVACLTMVTSVLLLALPISVIGTEFTRQWLNYKVDSEFERDKKTVTPRCYRLFKALKEQTRNAQDAQQDLRQRALDLDDRVQTIKALVSRRNAETAFLHRKIAGRSTFSTSGMEKVQGALDMDDLDSEMHQMFMSHRDYRATAREVKTIWSGHKLLKFTEFLISAEHVLDGLCNDDYDMVTQELDSLFFDVWRARAKLAATFGNERRGTAAPASVATEGGA